MHQAIDLLGRDHRRKWVLLVVLALTASGFEMVGAVLVYLLIGLVADPGQAIELPLFGDIRQLFGDSDEGAILLTTVAVIAVFFVLRGVVQVGTVYIQKRVAENAGARLSNRLVEGYLRMPYDIHLQRNSAELIRNSHGAVQQCVAQVFIPMINVTAASLVTLGMLTVLVLIAPGATGLAVVVVGGAAVVVLLFVQPKMKRLGLTGHQMQRDTLAWMQQGLHGIRDVKVLGRERYFARQYARSRIKVARVNYLRAMLGQLPSTIIESALIGFILLFFAATILVGEEAENALPVLGLFAYVGLRLQTSLQRVVKGLNDIKYATAPLDDLHADLLSIESLETTSDCPDPLPLNVSISLEDVEYRYAGMDQPAISEVTLTIRAGEQVGICGPTGSGKTTLADLMTGLLEPTGGSVSVDGNPLKGRERSWQQNLGVVPQMVFLIDDSLKRNIALGVPEDELDHEALQEAIELAQLKDFVASLSDGVDTVVGERGVRISGGQRQRIAIARALYRRPDVLVFDEGTSALDTGTEKRLMAAIDELRGTHTIILIAHRLSTVQRSDQVVFVEQGRIAGVGSFEELARSNDRFRALAASS